MGAKGANGGYLLLATCYLLLATYLSPNGDEQLTLKLLVSTTWFYKLRKPQHIPYAKP